VQLTSPVFGFLFALAIGFLIGRTREPRPGKPPRPGIRDFLIIAMLGALAGHLANVVVALALFAAVVGTIALMRLSRPERSGITTELAAIATFALSALCLTNDRPYGVGLAIVLSMVLAERDQLRSFVRDEISDEEYIDTLSFLGLIFIIYPLLPAGSFGPLKFFNPRQIWIFVILVSGVSYVGYFLTKYTSSARAALMTAIVGAIASTTAYTTAVSRAVAEAPESAVPASRYALISNSVMFPRMLVIVAPISPLLALAGVPAFAAMTIAGIIAAILLSRQKTPEGTQVSGSTFRNPFSLGPAIRFGIIVALITLFARAGRHYLGQSGQLTVAAISGLVDTSAISLALASSVQEGNSTATTAIIGMTLAAAANAVFKAAAAESSHAPAFYWRLAAGFVVMFAVGAIALWLVDPATFGALAQRALAS
jgi:uncharacterized membrane protein (DUF4010 family)